MLSHSEKYAKRKWNPSFQVAAPRIHGHAVQLFQREKYIDIPNSNHEQPEWNGISNKIAKQAAINGLLKVILSALLQNIYTTCTCFPLFMHEWIQIFQTFPFSANFNMALAIKQFICHVIGMLPLGEYF